MMTKFLFIAALGAAATFTAQTARAHGSMTTPPSRIYYCYLNGAENPTDPACQALRQHSGTAPFYDWMSIAQGQANGNHQAVVPDGTLCSGNQPVFAGLDLPRSDWHATPIAAGPDGSYEFIFRGTAPHATREWIFYVSRDSYSPAQSLHWSDLDEFCRLGNVALDEGNYHLRCTLPSLRGKRTIYSVWQRADSPEAFYTCIDVDFGNGGDAIFASGFQAVSP
ncbi:chitin binding protein [Tahibacter aquaticus]|uniref:Chitin binding protein n=1 Tax=Tahibacter aquaticus TaxID=520092 RepID=A0A4R6YV96_9GAMM|nr:lytic polysaccharide monooxygenase auxiliary activity family 9 protein [Tahibacter aquaticus]TDR42587.1 chitin binding protein [Tahibacter aquaticus]